MSVRDLRMFARTLYPSSTLICPPNVQNSGDTLLTMMAFDILKVPPFSHSLSSPLTRCLSPTSSLRVTADADDIWPQLILSWPSIHLVGCIQSALQAGPTSVSRKRQQRRLGRRRRRRCEAEGNEDDSDNIYPSATGFVCHSWN